MRVGGKKRRRRTFHDNTPHSQRPKIAGYRFDSEKNRFYRLEPELRRVRYRDPTPKPIRVVSDTSVAPKHSLRALLASRASLGRFRGISWPRRIHECFVKQMKLVEKKDVDFDPVRPVQSSFGVLRGLGHGWEVDSLGFERFEYDVGIGIDAVVAQRGENCRVVSESSFRLGRGFEVMQVVGRTNRRRDRPPAILCAIETLRFFLVGFRNGTVKKIVRGETRRHVFDDLKTVCKLQYPVCQILPIGRLHFVMCTSGNEAVLVDCESCRVLVSFGGYQNRLGGSSMLRLCASTYSCERGGGRGGALFAGWLDGGRPAIWVAEKGGLPLWTGPQVPSPTAALAWFGVEHTFPHLLCIESYPKHRHPTATLPPDLQAALACVDTLPDSTETQDGCHWIFGIAPP